jgi:anti-anti-sigma factor
LRQTFGAVCAESGVELLICDCSEVSFLSCSGLSVLVDFGGLLRRRGSRLCVVARHPAVLRLFALTEQEEALGLCTDLAAALTGTADPLPPPGATLPPPERGSASGRHPAASDPACI